MTPIIIFIEGNIGSGKTTFLKNLDVNSINSQKIFEPVDQWIESGMLKKFYKDPKKYAYEFQLYCLKTRFELFSKIDNTKDIIFIERSPMCDRYVFAEICLKDQIDKLSRYQEIWDQYMNQIYTSTFNYPYHFIYIDETYQNCYQHIKSRGRNAENNISLEYLSQLQNKHQQWFDHHEQIHISNFTYHKKDKSCYIQAKNVDVRKQNQVHNIVQNTLHYIRK